jgi:hypothetical protein
MVGITVVGGVGGYGFGLWSSSAQTAAANGAAVPLSLVSTPTDPATSQPTKPVKIARPNNAKALKKSELEYKLRRFDVEAVVRSSIEVEVPKNWAPTVQDPPKEMRYTDPTSLRWMRIAAGFTIRRPPAESMAAKIEALKSTPAEQDLTIVSRKVADDGLSATLTYTYSPNDYLRRVVVRWVALKGSPNAAVEIGATGLPQDNAAILDVLDRATQTITRTDTAL